MKKRTKRFTSIALAMALLTTSLVSGVSTKVFAAEPPSAETYQEFLELAVFMEEVGDTTVIDSIEDLDTVTTPYYVLANEASLAGSFQKYIELKVPVEALEEATNRVYVPSYDTDLYNSELAIYEDWFNATPELSDFTDDTEITVTKEDKLALALAQYPINFPAPVVPNDPEPILSDYKMDDVDSFNTAHTAWVDGGQIGLEPIQEDYKMDDFATFTIAHDAWVLIMDQYATDILAWDAEKPVLADFQDTISVTKTAQEKLDEALLFHNSMAVAEPDLNDYVLMTEEFFNTLKAADIVLRQSEVDGISSQFESWLVELYTVGIKATPVKSTPETPVEKVPTYVPTKEEAVRVSLTSSVPLETKVVKEDGTKSDTVVKNSIQGPRCYEAFVAAKPEESKIVRTLSIFAEGSNASKPVYKTDKAEVITLTIPESIKVDGGTYTMVCVSENGATTVFADEDTNPDTITFTTNVFYAYAICVK